MMMPPRRKEDHETVNLYSALMEEVKIRINAINHAALNRTGLMGQLVLEFGYLQLRFICELIALGCLVAHGDITATKAQRFRKEHAPGILLSMLGELHADFYPFPTIRKNDLNDPIAQLLLLQEGNFLRKEELINLYGKCGDKLHKGNLKKLLSPKSPIRNDFSEIVRWGQKIMDLLAFHTISRLSGEPLLCIMTNNVYGGRLTVYLASTTPPDQQGGPL